MAFNLFENILGTKKDPTQGLLYKTLSKFEPQATMATEALKDTAKMYEQKAQNISQWGKNTANAPGYVALGEALKRTFPKYSNRDSAELGKSAIEKFPDNQEYKKIVESQRTSLGYGAKALGGIGSMAVSAPGMVAGGAEQLGTGIGTMASARSGQDVVEGGLQALKGGVTAGFGVATGAMPIASTVFGGATGFEPVHQGLGYVGKKAGDISAGTAGFLGGNQQVQEQARGLGEIALPAVALGGLSKGGKIIKPVAQATGKAIVQGAEVIAPKVVQGVKKITPTLPKAEELLVNQLEKTNRMNPTKYTEFQQMAGERAGKFMADRKITGDAETNVSKLYDNFTKSKAEADKGLDAIQKTYKPSEVPPSYIDMLGELEKRFTYTKDNANLAKVQEFKSKLENGTLSHTDINGTKRLYEQKVKVNYIKDQNSLEVERATNIDNDVRNWQFDEASKLGFDNLKLINKETQLNRYLADNIGDKLARQLGNNNISLTDWIIAGQVPATPQALALLAGKKLAQNVVPKLYQKGLEKVARIPKKEAPVANIENIGKMETIRKSVTPQYDTNRLLVSPRSNSRSPAGLTPEVTLPKGEKGVPTKKSTIISEGQVGNRPFTTKNSAPKKVTPQKTIVKPKEVSEPGFTGMSLNNKGISKNLITRAINEHKGKEVTLFKEGASRGEPKVIKGTLQGMDVQDGLDNHMVLIKKDDSALGTSGHFYENIKDIQINGKSIFDKNKLNNDFVDEILNRKNKGQTPAGPTTFNTSGKKIIKKAPESPIALERGYTTSVKKPIVKRAIDIDSGLMAEAKKYKSADEFAKNSTNTYHGTSQLFDEFNNEALGRSTSTIAGKKGFWFTDDKGEALAYAKMSGKHMLKDELRIEKEINKILDQITIAEKKGNWDLADKLTEKISILEQESRAGGSEIVMPVRINKSNMLTYNADGISMNQGRIEKIIEQARKEGKDGVTFKNISDHPEDASIKTTQHFIFDTKNIKTESQLKRIYNKLK